MDPSQSVGSCAILPLEPGESGQDDASSDDKAREGACEIAVNEGRRAWGQHRRQHREDLRLHLPARGPPRLEFKPTCAGIGSPRTTGRVSAADVPEGAVGPDGRVENLVVRRQNTVLQVMFSVSALCTSSCFGYTIGNIRCELGLRLARAI